MGPPDLVHIVKGSVSSAPNSKVSQPVSRSSIGTYHFVTGVDASSSASIAAYLNGLVYLIDQTVSDEGDLKRKLNKSQGPKNKKKSFSLKSATYCCWNPFRKVDIRVEIKIPGGVNSYALPANGDKRFDILEF